jgi:hypothetical protein
MYVPTSNIDVLCQIFWLVEKIGDTSWNNEIEQKIKLLSTDKV